MNLKSLFIMASLIALLFSETFAADHSKLIERLAQNLPEKWIIQESKLYIKPYWSLSESTCTEVTLVGPNKTGYRFYDKDGSLILEHLSHCEAIYLWIADENFSHGWNLLKVIKDRFNLFPVKRPSQLIDEGIKVFGREGYYVFDTTYSKESPPSTHTARGEQVRRSWPGWRKDIRKILKGAQQSARGDAKNRAPQP